jgi:hypothetical protein
MFVLENLKIPTIIADENENFTITFSRKVGSSTLLHLFSKTELINSGMTNKKLHRIYEYVPSKDEEIIVVFRNPVDKLYSGHFMQLGKFFNKEVNSNKIQLEFWERLQFGYYLEEQSSDDITKKGLDFLVKLYEDKKWQFANQASFLYKSNGSSITPTWNCWKDYENVKWLHLDRLDNKFLKYVHKKVPSTSWCKEMPVKNKSNPNKFFTQIRKLLNDNKIKTYDIFYYLEKEKKGSGYDDDGVEFLLQYILHMECKTYQQIKESNRLFKYE